MGKKISAAAAEFSRAPSVGYKITRFWVILTQVLGLLLFLAGQQGAMLLGAEDDPEVISRRAAEEFCRRLIGLGPTFIKVGQILSTRGDLLSPVWMEVLSNLQSDVPADPFERVQQLLREELGARFDELDSIDPRPLKAASIATVHRARWRGREIVLKVQRTGIRELMRTDLAILRSIAQHCRFVPWLFPGIDPVANIDQIAITVAEELDFLREAQNYRDFRRVFERTSVKVIVPGTGDELCTEKVLALDYVPGTSPKDLRAPPSWQVERASRNLVDAFIHQIVVTGLFHADPHSGNMAIQPDGRIVFYDCGMLGRLSESTRKALADVAVHAITADATAIVEDLARAGILGSEAVGDDRVIEAIDSFLTLIEVGGISGDSVGVLAKRLLEQTDNKGRISVPEEFVLLGRSLIELEGTLATLASKAPSVDYRQIVLAQASGFVLARSFGSPFGVLDRITQDLIRTARIGRISARTLQRAVRQFETGQLALPVRDSATVKATRKLSPGVRSLNAAVLFGAFSLLSGLAFWDDTVILGVPLLLGGLFFLGRWLVSEQRMES
jgi:ubiquinone biosynthesis protein